MKYLTKLVLFDNLVLRKYGWKVKINGTEYSWRVVLDTLDGNLSLGEQSNEFWSY